MLRETSMVRITVVCPAGTDTIATGRAAARIRLATPSANSANGRWRRMREPRGAASWMSDRLEYRTPARRRRDIQIRIATRAGIRIEEGEGERRQQVDHRGGPACETALNADHGSRPSQRSDASPPISRMSRPAPATNEVTSICSGRMTRRVWMAS